MESVGTAPVKGRQFFQQTHIFSAIADAMGWANVVFCVRSLLSVPACKRDNVIEGQPARFLTAQSAINVFPANVTMIAVLLKDARITDVSDGSSKFTSLTTAGLLYHSTRVCASPCLAVYLPFAVVFSIGCVAKTLFLCLRFRLFRMRSVIDSFVLSECRVKVSHVVAPLTVRVPSGVVMIPIAIICLPFRIASPALMQPFSVVSTPLLSPVIVTSQFISSSFALRALIASTVVDTYMLRIGDAVVLALGEALLSIRKIVLVRILIQALFALTAALVKLIAGFFDATLGTDFREGKQRQLDSRRSIGVIYSAHSYSSFREKGGSSQRLRVLGTACSLAL